MKSDIAYYFIILYTLAMCKPVLPIVQDEIAHIFWKSEHMEKVHQHHGHKHIEVEIASAAQDEHNNEGSATYKTSEPVSIHLIVDSYYPASQLFNEKTKFGTRIYTASSLSLDKHYPPPRCC